MSELYQISTFTAEGLPVPLVRMSGALDITSGRELERAGKAIAGGKWSGMVLDVREVTTVDAQGIQALLNVSRAVRRVGKRIVMVDAVRPLRREWAACLLHRLMMIFPSLECAREAFPLEGPQP